MKLIFTSLFCFIFIFSLQAQNFSGQWRGSFVDNSTSFLGVAGQRVDYVLELESQGNEISGYSYSYYSDAGKRYYTICKISGTINTLTKEIIVTEFERTKFNTPPEIRNCFQTHKLKYVKENSDTESLRGTWYPAPNQNGDCGYGRTTLSRLIVKKTLNKKPETVIAPPKKNIPLKEINKQKQIVKQSNPVIKNQVPKTIIPPVVKNNIPDKKIIIPKKDSVVRKEIMIVKPTVKEPIVTSNIKFEKRINSVLKTIQIKNEKFTVDFYDNGEIDGDTISVFFNGKLVLSHRMLTDKPITLTLNADPTKENELVMYAESLGTIPPNTALMIVHDGDDRYEQRIESDLGKNGTIRFTYKSKDAP